MRISVRDPSGMLLGVVWAPDNAVERGTVKFACSKHRSGLLPLDDFEIATRIQVVTMRRDTYVTMPRFTSEGYVRGRADFVLRWEGPSEALRAIAGFEPATDAR